MYDFMVFGYFSSAIGRAYFPASSEFASLMFSMTTFAVGFLVRPLGAIFLGAYIDHIGRRKGLLATLALMSVGTLTIALVPGYETIGLFAPIVVVLGRLCQGFSAGVELGGVSVYLSEIATPGHKGFYVVLAIGQPAGGGGLRRRPGLRACPNWMPPEALQAWGWRIPLIVGCLIIPFIYMIRRSLQETEEFAARKHHPSPAEIYAEHADPLENHLHRRRDGAHDHGVLLYDHRLYPHIRQEHTPSRRRVTRCWSPCAWACRI